MRNVRVWNTALLAGALVAVAAMMTLYPSPSLAAALRGLAIWWDILFPALVPFFVIAELMLGFGIVHFFGTLLDPMMRPLFRVPGIGGFVMAMGFASGYPVGARLTAQLREQRLISREEGERLVSFTTSSDPIFLIGAVSIGFFHNAALAVVLAAAHYGTSIVIGLLMRFHGAAPDPAKPSSGATGRSVLRRALQAMHRARLEDGRSFGDMLRDAIQAALQLIMVVGGLVVFFCVVLEVLTLSGVIAGLYIAVGVLLDWAQLPAALAHPVVNGLFEVTLGAKSAAAAGETLSLASKAAIAGFVLSWAGMSVHAQVISLLSRTDLRYMPFLLARLLHGVLTAIAVLVLWEPLAPAVAGIAGFMPVFGQEQTLRPLLPALYSVCGIIFVATLAVVSALYMVVRLFRLFRPVPRHPAE